MMNASIIYLSNHLFYSILKTHEQVFVINQRVLFKIHHRGNTIIWLTNKSYSRFTTGTSHSILQNLFRRRNKVTRHQTLLRTRFLKQFFLVNCNILSTHTWYFPLRATSTNLEVKTHLQQNFTKTVIYFLH